MQENKIYIKKGTLPAISLKLSSDNQLLSNREENKKGRYDCLIEEKSANKKNNHTIQTKNRFSLSKYNYLNIIEERKSEDNILKIQYIQSPNKLNVNSNSNSSSPNKNNNNSNNKLYSSYNYGNNSNSKTKNKDKNFVVIYN
jgi:hypothetical protein